jgi:hypothetical protein
MHPDIARQLAAERRADLQKEASALSAPGRPRRSWRLRPRALARYAGALTGARSGT